MPLVEIENKLRLCWAPIRKKGMYLNKIYFKGIHKKQPFSVYSHSQSVFSGNGVQKNTPLIHIMRNLCYNVVFPIFPSEQNKKILFPPTLYV